MTEIPFRSETFDLVFSFDVLPQVPLKMDELSRRLPMRSIYSVGCCMAR